MKRAFRTYRAWVVGFGLLLAVSAVLAGAGAQVASVSPSGQAAAAVDPAQLRAKGFESALTGDFASGLEALRQVVKILPKDEAASEAVKLLAAHLTRRQTVDNEREDEYNDTVHRIAHSRIAQEYIDKADKDRVEKLREKVRDVARAYNESDTADRMEEAPDKEKAAEIRAASIKALKKASAALAELVKLLGDESGEYAKTALSVAGEAKTVLREHQAAWKATPTDDVKARRIACRKLKELEYREADVLSDLENMAVEKPWRLGLVQARLAVLLAPNREKLASEQWFIDLVKRTDERGKKHVEKAEWYDALNAYTALKELLPDNEEYQRAGKVVLRHVRVLGLYGHAGSVDSADTGDDPNKPADPNSAAEDEEPHWREVVANVDADMIEKVIGQLDLAYVSSVDYRKVTCGGLTSVKILAETPQAAHSFPSLKDDAKRKQFAQAIDRLIQDVAKHDRVDHLNLILALNSVLRASERSVDLPTEVLAVEFTDGFLSELDKFSSMIWPYALMDFEKHTMGKFYGIGVQITKEPGEPLKVVSPLMGTPAYRAGLKAGDLIMKVDGKETSPRSVDKLVDLIMGDEGSKVTLTIKRGGRTIDYEIVRKQIDIKTVKGWLRKPGSGKWDYRVDPEGQIGYLRLTQFTGTTADDVAAALAAMRGEGIRSVIMDLRFNPGGLLRSAAQVANEFLHSGKIVSTRGRRTRPVELNANPFGRYLDGDLVVLVNQYSASAAEIVSGALKDWKRAKIVGQRSYGKGSVQNVIPIRSHSARLKLTTAYYYLPHGRLLHKKNGAKDWGVDPDVEIVMTPQQARRWLDIRQKTDIIQDEDDGQLQEEISRQYDADIQLDTAVLMLKLLQLQHRQAA